MSTVGITLTILALVMAVNGLLFLNYLRGVRRRRAQGPREVELVSWAEGDRRLREEQGWELAPEEDRNHRPGMVWLQRFPHEVA